ncbi:MAG: DUF5939 domain-containing protein, partial [Dongiaceae bacterium]
MQDKAPLFASFAQCCAPAVVQKLQQLINEAPDVALNRMNPLRFAQEFGFAEKDCIAAFLHGTRLGLLELGWNVLCPGCAGTLLAGSSLRDIVEDKYACAFCGREDPLTLDESIEV